MKSLLFLSACGLVLTAAAGCAPTTPATARVALDCPSYQGDLKLTNVAPDKKSCAYVSSEGDQVSLRLIPVSAGAYENALQPVEQELQGEIQTPADKSAAASAQATETAAAATGASRDAAQATQQAAQDAAAAVHISVKDTGKKSTAGKADDDEDGNVRVDAEDTHGGHANIDLPGIHIHADGDNNQAKVDIAGVHIDGSDEGATIRTSHEVRLRGEGLSAHRNGFRSTFVLAREDLKDGWRAVGYEAGGPKTGPITVAVFKARDGGHEGSSEDVKRLVRRNAGV
jgi:hypothetical protein